MYIQQYNEIKDNRIYYVATLNKGNDSIIVFESYYRDEIEPNVIALAELLGCFIDGELF